jgi:putative aminopeptidase FrvX
MSLPTIDSNYLVQFLTGLLNTPSPSGFTAEAVAYTEKALGAFPRLSVERTSKGALLATLAGKKTDAPRAISAHVDTLGAMVKEIKSNGRLQLTTIGGSLWNSLEAEGCTIFTSAGKRVRGSLLPNKASTHVYGKDVFQTPRDDDKVEVRLDERTTSAEETFALGINVGDYVAFDPRVEVTNGFVRSRYLDDKACVACMAAAVKAICDAGLTPAQKAYFYASTYEEVGHGGSSGIPDDAAEIVVADMAAVGQGQNSDEFHTTVCVKDSSGPYDHDLSNRLRQIAEKYQIPYKVDIYTYYGSDGSTYWRAGGHGLVALIGPGIDASHHYERAHIEGLVATAQWIAAYLLEE